MLTGWVVYGFGGCIDGLLAIMFDNERIVGSMRNIEDLVSTCQT